MGSYKQQTKGARRSPPTTLDAPSASKVFLSAIRVPQLKKHVVWTLPLGFNLGNLDLEHYIPILIAGLAVTEDPYDYIAEQVFHPLCTFRRLVN